MKIIATFLLMLTAAFAAPAQSASSAAAGTPERKAVLAALRIPVKQDLKQDVVFKVDQIVVRDRWAFVRGVPQRPGGAQIDYSATKYNDAIRAGAFDDGFAALLRWREGAWHVVTYEIGATDVAWLNWTQEYGAPAELFE